MAGIPRRALVIGIGEFAKPPLDGDCPDPRYRWDDLEFAKERITDLGDALAAPGVGYEVDVQENPVCTTLATQLATHLSSPGHRIVHVLSHGDSEDDRSGRLDIVPACCNIGPGTNLAGWISDAQRMRRSTLFLVDLCKAGLTLDVPALRLVRSADRFAWVIAASWHDAPAYGGVFTQVVAEVIRQCAQDGLGTLETFEYVSFDAFYRRIKKELGSSHQTICHHPHYGDDDGNETEARFPFFRNPGYRADAATEVAADLDDLLRPFVSGKYAGQRRRVKFFGRARHLMHLAHWLESDSWPDLHVVTGAPGSGKSSLVGALACCAHGELFERSRQLRESIPVGLRPSKMPRFAAVYARGRTVDELVASIARQWHVELDRTMPGVASLINAMRAAGTAATLVVDALDEAVAPTEVVEWLILPLTVTRLDDGDRTVCRVLVAARRRAELARMFEAADQQSGLIDLSDVTSDADPGGPAAADQELRQDIGEYLASMLADMPTIATAGLRGARAAFAAKVGEKLVAHEAQELGAFLCAGLIVEHLRLRLAHGTVNANTLRALADEVPTTLPGIVELDLAHRDDAVKVRAVLVALAHAKGDGVDAETIGVWARAISGVDLHPREVVELLDSVASYRHSTGGEHNIGRHRLFHEKLAEHFRAHVHRPGPSAGQAWEAGSK